MILHRFLLIIRKLRHKIGRYRLHPENDAIKNLHVYGRPFWPEVYKIKV